MWSKRNQKLQQQRGQRPRCIFLKAETIFFFRVTVLIILLPCVVPFAHAQAQTDPWTGIPPETVENPVNLTIPVLNIEADVQTVGLDRIGAMGLPDDWHDVGWYRGSARLGEWNTVVISGHVDHYTGPAVFFKLKELQPGDKVVVEGQNGTRWRYRVIEKQIKPLGEWKSREVFASRGRFPTLHLFSCTGAFSKSAQTHLERILVRCELEKVIPVQ